MGESSNRGQKNWRWSSKKKATTGSKNGGRRRPPTNDRRPPTADVLTITWTKIMLPTESKELYLSEFKHRSNGANKNPSWLQKLRTAGMESFQELGFPTLHDEDWKYTSLDRITSVGFARANGEAEGISADQIAELACADAECNRLTFINGNFFPALSFVRGVQRSEERRVGKE